MKNYDDIEIFHDDGSDVGNPDALLAYREYYAGRLVVREGVYIDEFPCEADDFLEGLGGVGYEEE